MARIYKAKGNKKSIITLILILVIGVSVIYGVWSVSESLMRTQDREALETAQNAIVKSAVQCYALEGQYPTGIQYLEDNYGLTLDRKKYVYHYESIGANMVPEIRVYPLD